MRAKIISTGEELVLGTVNDTNAAYLARQLRELGITVSQILVIGDHLKTMVTAFENNSRNSDIILVTGGLGPTQDDITARAAADAMGDILEMNNQALASMKSFFKKRGFQLTGENEKQAMLPSRSVLMENQYGTAPGFYMTLKQCMLFFMPGVPSEMEKMFHLSVKPVIQENFELKETIFMKKLSIFGLPESQVGSRLKGFDKKFKDISLGFRAVFPTIEIKLVQYHQKRHIDDDLQSQASQLQSAAGWIKSKIDRYIYSEEGLSLQEALGKELAARKKTVAVAESCTGGLIASLITDVAGSSDYFVYSAVTYSNDAKVEFLDVKKETIVDFGAVHEQTAKEMAVNVKDKCGADYGISTSGIAGPGGGSLEKPVGTVCIGLAGPGTAKSKRYHFPFDDRKKNKQIFAATALNSLLKLVRAG